LTNTDIYRQGLDSIFEFIHYKGSWEIRMGRENNGQSIGGSINPKKAETTWNYQGVQVLKNQWHHVVMTYDGEELLFYLDKIKKTSNRESSKGDILIKNTPVTIGQSGPGHEREFFYGCIDEVVIYNQTLSEKEVTKLYEKKFIKN